MASFDWKLSRDDRKILPAILYVRLRGVVERNRALLSRSKRRGDIAVVAWLTRNLVELRVWVEYCAMSDDNALEFCDDAVRDLIELNRKIPGLDATTRAELDAAQAALPSSKATHKFKDVKEAASEAGLDQFYRTNFKSLSKFAHPTALSVMATPEDAGAHGMRTELVKVGLAIANEALEKLETSFIGERHRKYALSMIRVNEQLPKSQRVK